MKTGFKYKGIHTSKMGVSMRSKSRPILPGIRQSLLTLPSTDGTLDYGAANEYGRTMYDDRVFNVLLHITAADVYELQRRASKIATWLTGSGELIFDDMPDAVWEVCVINGVDFVPEMGGRKALLSVNFRAKPFSHALFDTASGARLGDAIALSADIPFDFNTSMQFNVAGAGEFNAFNYGSAPVRPKFVITPVDSERTPGEMKISCRGRELCTNADFTVRGTVVVDMEKRTVIVADVQDISGIVTGQFFELASGDNIVTFSEANGAEYVIDVIYTPRFIYNTDWTVRRKTN